MGPIRQEDLQQLSGGERSQKSTRHETVLDVMEESTHRARCTLCTQQGMSERTYLLPQSGNKLTKREGPPLLIHQETVRRRRVEVTLAGRVWHQPFPSNRLV